MAFPAGLQLVTVHCRFDNLPSGGASGRVAIINPYTLLGPVDNSIVPPFTVAADLDATGQCTVILPATNDPDWTPQGWAYTVQVATGGTTIRGTLQLDYLTTSVELADLLQVDGTAMAGITYATLAQLNALSATNAAGISAAGGGYFKATDHGLAGWTFDPAQVQAGTIQPTAGLAQVARIRVLTGTVSAINFHLTAGGSGLTVGQCFASLHNDAGALLGAGAVTVDQAANWATGGYKTCALQVAQAVTQYAFYRVLWWFQGTTGPTMSRAVNSSSAILNAGLAAPNFRFSTADAGLTTVAPTNIGTQTGGPTAWWVGVTP